MCVNCDVWGVSVHGRTHGFSPKCGCLPHDDHMHFCFFSTLSEKLSHNIGDFCYTSYLNGFLLFGSTISFSNSYQVV